MRRLAILLVLVACGKKTKSADPPDALPPIDASPPLVETTPPLDDETCVQIARDIESAKARFPALADFQAARSGAGRCRISYEFHCHKSTIRGGWRAAVPEPDPDGIWFYIGLWHENDPDERMSQINTQPMIGHHYIDGRRVTFLVQAGEKSGGVPAELSKILTAHGMRESNAP